MKMKETNQIYLPTPHPFPYMDPVTALRFYFCPNERDQPKAFHANTDEKNVSIKTNANKNISNVLITLAMYLTLHCKSNLSQTVISYGVLIIANDDS